RAELDVQLAGAEALLAVRAPPQQVALDQLAVGPLVRVAAVEEHDRPLRRLRPHCWALPLDVFQINRSAVGGFAGDFSVADFPAPPPHREDRLHLVDAGGNARPRLAVPASAGEPALEEVDVELAAAQRHDLGAELLAADIALVLALELEVGAGLPGIGKHIGRL